MTVPLAIGTSCDRELTMMRERGGSQMPMKNRCAVDLEVDMTQHVCGLIFAHQQHDTQSKNCKDYSASSANNVEQLKGIPMKGSSSISGSLKTNQHVEEQLGVGLEGIPVKGVLSPIKNSCLNAYHISKLRMSHVPTYCHTFASKVGLSSKRTRVAAGAFLKWSMSQLWRRNTIRNRIKYWCRKRKKQKERLLFIETTEEMRTVREQYNKEYLKTNIVVFNGETCNTRKVTSPKKKDFGSVINKKLDQDRLTKKLANQRGSRKSRIVQKDRRKTITNKYKSKGKSRKKKATSKPKGKKSKLPLREISIAEGGLVVTYPPDASRGLAYVSDGAVEPIFMLLSRNEALEINKNGKQLCAGMRRVIHKHRQLRRGVSKDVFSDYKYCCLGAKPRRSAVGVEPGHYKMEDGVDSKDWDIVVKAIRRAEHAFHNIAGTDVIRRIEEARNNVGWERAQLTEGAEGEKIYEGREGKIFNGIAFGLNIHLRAHIDHDFTYSLIQVHVDDVDYEVYDEIVCYFCFPERGIAVPMKAGDFLVIDAMEYHCVSSRCDPNLDVFCLSSYLKTAVVGGNNNKRGLSNKEEEGLRAYDDMLAKDKKG